MPRFERPLRALPDDVDSIDSEDDAPEFARTTRNNVRKGGLEREITNLEDDEQDGEDFIDEDSESDDNNVDEDMIDEEDFSSDEANGENNDEDQPVDDDFRTISFGALASAQDSLRSQHGGGRRPAENEDNNNAPRTDADKVNALRARLAELKAIKERHSNPRTSSSLHNSNKLSHSHPRSPPLDTSSTTARSSKHAPTAQSSKYQVKRQRTIIPTSQNPTHSRDPRFLAGRTTLSTLPVSEATRLEHNYAFLNDYRAAETQELRSTLSAIKATAKKRRSGHLTEAEEHEKARLERAVQAAENRARVEKGKEHLQSVVREHRKQEREAVKQGKTPFFLKRSEIKKKVLEARWKGMKGREKEKAVKRRRKKVGEREKRSMPTERRAR